MGFSAQGILSPDQGSAPLKIITTHRQPSNHLASLASPASDLFRPMVLDGSGKAGAKQTGLDTHVRARSRWTANPLRVPNRLNRHALVTDFARALPLGERIVKRGSERARKSLLPCGALFRALRSTQDRPVLQTQRAQAMRTAAGESEECCGVDHRIRGQLGRFAPRSRFLRLLRVAIASVLDHSRIKFCTSIPDFIGRHLLVEYCGRDDLAHAREATG